MQNEKINNNYLTNGQFARQPNTKHQYQEELEERKKII